MQPRGSHFLDLLDARPHPETKLQQGFMQWEQKHDLSAPVFIFVFVIASTRSCPFGVVLDVALFQDIPISVSFRESQGL